MQGPRLLQLYLLSQMRAATLVQTAYRDLGASVQELKSVAAEADIAGLSKPGHSMAVYARLLGEPFRSTRTSLPDSYLRRLDQYVLPLWPSFAFSIYGSEEGVTGGTWFSLLPESRQQETTDLVPWRIVEEQVRPLLSHGRIVDEWYPMKDYVCPSTQDSKSEIILRFDFELLQEVTPINV